MKLLNSYTAILFIYFTRNNILCTITNLQGNTLAWSTAGTKKLKGAKKITISSIHALSKTLSKYSSDRGILTVYVKVKGTNRLKSSFIKSLKLLNFNILLLQEKLCLPHSGCRKNRIRKL